MIELVDKNNLTELNNFLLSNELSKMSLDEFNSNPFMHAVVYRFNNKIIGYLNYSIMYDKAELNQIIVSQDNRNIGIGSILLKYFLNICAKCNDITLEVGVDNIPAINLYKKFGFKSVAIRKNYYGNMDGILMAYERGE